MISVVSSCGGEIISVVSSCGGEIIAVDLALAGGFSVDSTSPKTAPVMAVVGRRVSGAQPSLDR